MEEAEPSEWCEFGTHKVFIFNIFNFGVKLLKIHRVNETCII